MARKIYVVISQTGTLISKGIRFVSGDNYNHVSLSLNEQLSEMYSFGRRTMHNPLNGGLIKESPESGVLKRFKDTKVIVLEFLVDEDSYERLWHDIHQMYIHRQDYNYNFVGLFIAIFGFRFRHGKEYYCSQFVEEMLCDAGFSSIKKDRVIKPVDFLQYPSARIIYSGLLTEYVKQIMQKNYAE